METDDPNIPKLLEKVMGNNCLKSKLGTSVHKWKTADGWITKMHTNSHSVLCVVIKEVKTFYLGPKELDARQHKKVMDRNDIEWNPDRTSITHYWEPSKTSETLPKYLDGGFKKVTLSRGDAVCLPKRFAHAIFFFEKDSLILSINVDKPRPGR